MKTVQCRVVDLDAGTVAALRAYRAVRGLVALDLVHDAALVLGDLDGTHRHPDRFSPRVIAHVVQARKALWEELLPVIRLHDLRHTHATLLLAARRAGQDGARAPAGRERHHHPHRLPARHPGMGREAADRFAALLEG